MSFPQRKCVFMKGRYSLLGRLISSRQNIRYTIISGDTVLIFGFITKTVRRVSTILLLISVIMWKTFLILKFQICYLKMSKNNRVDLSIFHSYSQISRAHQSLDFLLPTASLRIFSNYAKGMMPLYI